MTFEDNFLHHYQSILFRDTDSDPFVTCSVRRKCLAVAFRAANTFASNETACNLLSEKLSSYVQHVDNKGGVNNYINSVNELTSSCETECQQWKSQFNDAESIFSELIQSSKSLKEAQTCQGSFVTEDDIRKNLFQHSWGGSNDDGNVGNRFNQRSKQAKSAGHKTNFLSKKFSNCPTKTVATANTNHENQFGNGCENLTPQHKTFQYGNNSSHQMKQDSFAQGLWSNATNNGNSSSTRAATGVADDCIALRRTVDHQAIDEHSQTDKKFVVLYENLGFNNSGLRTNTVQNSNDMTCQQMEGENKFGMQQTQNVFNTRVTISNKPQIRDRVRPQQMEGGNDCGPGRTSNVFRTARDELNVQHYKKWGNRGGYNSGCPGYSSYSSAVQKKSLGARRGVTNKFVPPMRPNPEDNFGGMMNRGDESTTNWDPCGLEDESLKNIDPKMVDLIRSEIMDCGAPVEWDDIAGLQFAKATIQEIVVWPLLRPEIFTGLRRPPKGILLFGPPGTGKTLIGKCIASQSCSTFFSISASSLTSKWIGDGEKMVRALFAVARCHQPAVIFIDEIDSLLSQRSDSEHESSRRIKTEFLVQLDGAATGEEDRILVIGATNRPQELDEAARRRLVKRLYIPLPEYEARHQLVVRLMSTECHSLTMEDVNEISTLTDGYSGADMKNLCQEASLGPIRSLTFKAIKQITPDQVRPISVEDFKNALSRVRASVSSSDLDTYVTWDKQYGSGCC